jgi:hypothetical protein
VTGIGCPSCAQPMQRREFERRPLGKVELDLCFSCRAIWFDAYESAQLTPGGVIELFRELHLDPGEAPHPLADGTRCPKCHDRLALTHDFQRTNRITYYRCAHGHGRLTSFIQFLREKNFVRSLTLAEIERLKVHVAQVRCSSCGAPVDLERDAQCAYCRAPIAILDAQAVERALAELSAAERKRTTVDPTAAVDALLAGKRFERTLSHVEGPVMVSSGMVPVLVDLVGEALGLLLENA